jgi:rhodanese-related sulfurtransferase
MLVCQHALDGAARGRPAEIWPTYNQLDLNSLDQLLAAARSRLTRLSPGDALEAVRHGARLVDIRPEFQRRRDGEIAGAIVIERNHLEWRLLPGSDASIPEAVDNDVAWIILCDEGFASSLAAATLQHLGLHRSTDVVGGFRAWRAAGFPVGPSGACTQPRLAGN